MKSKFVWLSAAILILVGVPLWVLHPFTPPAPQSANRPRPSEIYPSVPLLRIEVGQHSSTPTSMSVDRAGRYLITGGLDKAIRVWALPSSISAEREHANLELLDVLRPPIADGNVGKIYSVALSPDGSLAAAGGRTGIDGNQHVYIFDRARGRIVATLSMPQVATCLAFSPDGHALAVGQKWKEQGGGLQIWRAQDGQNWHPVAADRDYGDDVYGLSFDKDGLLASAGLNGRIRLYDAQFKRVAVAKASGGAHPVAIAFSPDGGSLVVGYNDSTAVVLLDGRNLTTTRMLQEPGPMATGGRASDNAFLSVAWSSNGRYVFASGKVSKNGISIVRRWDTTVDRHPQDFAALGNIDTVQALAPFGRDGVLVLGGDPFIGAYDANGSPLFPHGPVQHDMRTYGDQRDFDAFRVSTEGGVVEIPGRHVGQGPLRIDLAQRRVSEIADSDAAMAPPKFVGGAFEVVRWHHDTAPALVRSDDRIPHLLALKAHEFARSLAIAPSDKRFVLGTDSFLRLYSDHGMPLWPKPIETPGVVWRVNITPDEKLVVAALADGTVRWYRLEDGHELLALFIREPDSQLPERRWIAWTSSGYYDASPGGERLIGWHINRGPDNAALFYPADRFRDAFYRPDLIGQVLKTRVVPAAPPTDTIIKRLPPIVHILDVARDANGNALVNYEVESPSGMPITAVDCTINGKSCNPEGAKGLPSGGKQLMQIKAAPNATEVSISAATQDGPGIVRSAAIPNAIPQHGPLTGKLFALVIGVSRYQDRIINERYPLRYADKDAIDFAKALTKQEGKIYSKVTVRSLINERATRQNIAQQLAWLTDEPGGDDVSLLFISGHGQSRQKNNTGKQTSEYYFLPFDVDFANGQVPGTALSHGEIIKYIANGSSKKLVFLDTCHSGTMGEQDATGMVNTITRDGEGHRVVVWASSTANQDSIERADWGHGAFTFAILDALYGRQDAPLFFDGPITPRLLGAWLDRRVKKLTRGQQTPSTIDLSGAAFDIATVVPAP